MGWQGNGAGRRGVSLTRARSMAALDAAFDEHLKMLFETWAGNTSVKPDDASHFAAGLARAVTIYGAAAAAIERQFSS